MVTGVLKTTSTQEWDGIACAHARYDDAPASLSSLRESWQACRRGFCVLQNNVQIHVCTVLQFKLPCPERVTKVFITMRGQALERIRLWDWWLAIKATVRHTSCEKVSELEIRGSATLLSLIECSSSKLPVPPARARCSSFSGSVFSNCEMSMFRLRAAGARTTRTPSRRSEECTALSFARSSAVRLAFHCFGLPPPPLELLATDDDFAFNSTDSSSRSLFSPSEGIEESSVFVATSDKYIGTRPLMCDGRGWPWFDGLAERNVDMFSEGLIRPERCG